MYQSITHARGYSVGVLCLLLSAALLASAPRRAWAQQAKPAEVEAKNKAIEEENRKISEINVIVNRSFLGGNEALSLKRYDEAIAFYDEGLATDPTHPGVPVLLTNKSVALRARGVDRYNAALASKDAAKKASELKAAGQDFREAAEAATNAVRLLESQQPSAVDPADLKMSEGNKYYALVARAEALRLLVSKVDPKLAGEGLNAFREYIAAETDPDKKAKAQLDLAQMLMNAAANNQAVAEFRRILADDPNNLDANFGIAQALIQSGSKGKVSEASDHLRLFLSLAPDTDKRKADARDLLEVLRNEGLAP